MQYSATSISSNGCSASVGRAIEVCGDGCSVSVLRRLFCITIGIGEATGDDTGRLRETVSLNCSSSVKEDELGSGCTHCTDVPCQLHVASVQATRAWGCKISMLSIDTIVSVRGIRSGMIPCVILSLTTNVARRLFVSTDAGHENANYFRTLMALQMWDKSDCFIPYLF